MLMRINLMYATYSSGTQTVADHIQATLTAHGHRVRLVEIRDFVPGDIDADLLLFGSPSWQRANFKYNGQPHHDFFPFFQQYSYDIDAKERISTLDLAAKPCAIFGLGDHNYPVFCGAVDHLEDFVRCSHGILCTPSLRLHAYLFHEKENQALLDRWIDILPLK